MARSRCSDILRTVLRRSVGLALVAAMATLQCVSWADVDDARQPTRDGRAIVADSGTHGGTGVARAKGSAPTVLSGMTTGPFVLINPAVSSVTGRAGTLVRFCEALAQFAQAPRSPPALG
jgi:hypothetical protein